MKTPLPLHLAWMFLAAAIVFEVVGSTSMKLSDGMTRLTPTLMMFAFYALAFACNTQALRRLDLSVTYAIWSGAGTLAVAVIGMTYFREPVTLLRIGSTLLIVLGILGLTLSATRE